MDNFINYQGGIVLVESDLLQDENQVFTTVLDGRTRVIIPSNGMIYKFIFMNEVDDNSIDIAIKIAKDKVRKFIENL